MRKSIAVTAFAVVMVVGALASAAPVDIFIRRDLVDPNVWRISSIAQVPNGGIALEVAGFTGMTLAPLSQIMPLDSGFFGGSAGAVLQIIARAGQNLIPIGQPELVLATLIGPGLPFIFSSTQCVPGSTPDTYAPPCAGIKTGDDAYGYTALNQRLTDVVGYSLTIVPEPVASVLLAFGLAAISLVRRRV
jgi:hypothetical protein